MTPETEAEAMLDPTAGLGDVQASPDPQPIEEEEEKQEILIAPAVMDIDKKLGGGLPLESVTLIEGDPESGKSVLVQQLSFDALKQGLRTVIFLSESTVRQLPGPDEEPRHVDDGLLSAASACSVQHELPR